MSAHRLHRMDFGAEPEAGGATRFRLWAPAVRDVQLILENGAGAGTYAMRRDVGGWFTCIHDRAPPGTLYRFQLDGGIAVPDPASRYQPQDVTGPSEVVDPTSFEWRDEDWTGRHWDETVLYELHVGAFTPEGTFRATEEKLDHLVGLGITAIELMPVAEAPRRRNWGYDGAYLFAPNSAYGRPEDLKALVQAAHERGLMVFLDVVYNHFGPEGNFLHHYTPGFFTECHHTPWGAAINFDGGLRPVREFYIQNALFWLEEYRFDGLRLDAVHAIEDDSKKHILEELAEVVMGCCQGRRHVHLVLENDKNESRYLERYLNGCPRHYAAQWSDDIHHALHVLITGEKAGYYADFAEMPAYALARSLAEGFTYQGEPSPYRNGQPRGEPSAHLPPTAFVSFLQNHDQVGNRALGERIVALAPEAAIEAAMALLLLAPSPPLLFMGQEWGARQPFPFFCDFDNRLADAVRDGRRSEFANFPAFRSPEARERIPDPNDPETFASAILDWDDAVTAAGKRYLALHRNLLDLRREEIVPRLAGVKGGAGSFRLLSTCGIMIRWQLGNAARLWLLANLGEQPVHDAPAPPAGRRIFVTGEPDETSWPDDCIWPAWSVAWIVGDATGAAAD